MGSEDKIPQKQWLIRKCESTAGHEFYSVLGPYWTDQVRLMVEQGMLEADDELCPENGYWFPLHEIAEVRRELNVDPIILRRLLQDWDDEPTEPDLVIDDAEAPETTAVLQIGSVVQKSPLAKPREKQGDPKNAASLLTPQELASRFKRAEPGQAEKIRFDQSRFWTVLFIVCSLFAIASVVWVIKTLRA